MADDCIFCKIVNREIDADIVYEDDRIIAFKDVNAQAPVHFLFVPKKHIETLNDISQKNAGLVADILVRAGTVAAENNIAADGYRVVINCNRNAQQEVFHLHVHLLGGRKFSWPPG